jgi:DNA-binding NarL/FixJ family response regulator
MVRKQLCEKFPRSRRNVELQDLGSESRSIQRGLRQVNSDLRIILLTLISSTATTVRTLSVDVANVTSTDVQQAAKLATYHAIALRKPHLNESATRYVHYPEFFSSGYCIHSVFSSSVPSYPLTHASRSMPVH